MRLLIESISAPWNDFCHNKVFKSSQTLYIVLWALMDAITSPERLKRVQNGTDNILVFWDNFESQKTSRNVLCVQGAKNSERIKRPGPTLGASRGQKIPKIIKRPWTYNRYSRVWISLSIYLKKPFSLKGVAKNAPFKFNEFVQPSIVRTYRNFLKKANFYFT